MDLLGSDISLDDVKNVPDSPEYSLSAILAEYGEAPAAASGVEARSREIVMEALGGDHLRRRARGGRRRDGGPAPAAPA